MADPPSAVANAMTAAVPRGAAVGTNGPAVSPDPWDRVLGLRCQMSVELPVPAFKVNDLMSLRAQLVLDTRWRVGSDVPIRVNGQLIGWGEFDTIRNRLAVRLTEVASK